MTKLLIKWILFAGIIMATCYLPGISVENFAYAMLIALILTVVNIFVKPILKLVTFPINMLSCGLFNLVINFGILMAISYFIPQYEVHDLLSGFIASVGIAVSYCIIKGI